MQKKTIQEKKIAKYSYFWGGRLRGFQKCGDPDPRDPPPRGQCRWLANVTNFAMFLKILTLEIMHVTSITTHNLSHNFWW